MPLHNDGKPRYVVEQNASVGDTVRKWCYPCIRCYEAGYTAQGALDGSVQDSLGGTDGSQVRIDEIMKARSMLILLIASATLAMALTGFYFVHESLPRAIRAPTSLMLAPVALVDGLCYALGVPGIYGRPVPVLLVNWVSGVGVCFGALRAKRWWQKRKVASSDTRVAQQRHVADGASRRS